MLCWQPAASDFRAAEKQYEQALAARPDDAELWQRLGLVRHLQNEFAPAAAAFEQAVRLKPELWGAQLFLGIDYYRMNQFARALPHLERAAKLKPAEGEARYWLGATQLALKQYFEGLEILEALPKNAEVLRLLAQAYSDFATALHNEVVAKYPDSAAAHEIHGQALENEGATAEALKEYRAALALDPGREEARRAVERLSAQR